LKNWLAFGSEDKLLEALELAKHIGLIKFAIGFYRIMLCPGIAPMKQYQGTIAKALKKFIDC